jgi:hypothetical protein
MFKAIYTLHASMATPAPCGNGVGWTRIAYPAQHD